MPSLYAERLFFVLRFTFYIFYLSFEIFFFSENNWFSLAHEFEKEEKKKTMPLHEWNKCQMNEEKPQNKMSVNICIQAFRNEINVVGVCNIRIWNLMDDE